jgi:hypothetical protein
MWLTYSFLQRFLMKILPEYSVHPQIVRQIWDAFPTALFITSTPPFAKCVIATFWSDFAQLMQERFRTLDFFPDRRSISLGGENLQVVCASYPVASLI